MSKELHEAIGMATGYMLFAGYSAVEAERKLVQSHEVDEEIAAKAVSEVTEATLR